MARVFLSYADSEKAFAAELVALLERHHHAVSSSGERDPTYSERDRSDCTLVIWSMTSVRSPFVYEDAIIASKRGRLIQVATNVDAVGAVPAIFEHGHVMLAGQPRSVLAAIEEIEEVELVSRNQPMAALSGVGPRDSREQQDQARKIACERNKRETIAADALQIESGRLVHRISSIMRAGIIESIDIRIGTGNTRSLTIGLAGRGQVAVENIPTVETMSVELFCQSGIKLVRQSRRTQLVRGPLLRAVASDRQQFGRWLWKATPKIVGTHEIFVSVTADLRDSRGVVTSVSLPDRTFAVKVKVNYARTTAALFKWGATGVGSMLLAGLVGAYSQEVWWPMVKTWLVGLGLKFG